MVIFFILAKIFMFSLMIASLIYDLIRFEHQYTDYFPIIFNDKSQTSGKFFYFKSWTRLAPYMFGLWVGSDFVNFKTN